MTIQLFKLIAWITWFEPTVRCLGHYCRALSKFFCKSSCCPSSKLDVLEIKAASRVPITWTLGNSNLLLIRTFFDSPSGHFLTYFTLDNSTLSIPKGSSYRDHRGVFRLAESHVRLKMLTENVATKIMYLCDFRWLSYKTPFKKKNISNNHDINTWELKSTLENCAYHATSMSFVCLLHKVEMKMILLKVLQRLNMYYSRVLS